MIEFQKIISVEKCIILYLFYLRCMGSVKQRSSVSKENTGLGIWLFEKK